MLNFIQAVIKYSFMIAIIGITFSCSQSMDYTNPDLSPETRAELLLNELTIEEKVGQMCQYVGINHMKVAEGNMTQEEMRNSDAHGFYQDIHSSDVEEMVKQGKIGSFLHIDDAHEVNHLQKLAMQSKHKIPLLIAIDAIHGHGFYAPGATIFPTEIGMASGWDTSLSRKIAEVTAKEMRATGYHWTFSPNIEISRDPRWGRVGETFGEDPLVASQHGVAMIKGYQGNLSEQNNVLACAKHFVAGGDPVNGLNFSPMDVSERRLKEIYFPPFEAAVNAGVATFMAAHNEVNGMPCHANKYLLQDVLRDEWNFEGFVVSDWTDIARLHTTHRIAPTLKDADRLAIEAGINVHMHGPGFYDEVIELVKEGSISEERIDEMVRPILMYKFMLGVFEQPFADTNKAKSVLLTNEHIELALHSARKSIVLLENKNGILPLSKNIDRVFVSGPNSNNQTILGDWAKPQPDDNVITVLEGLKAVSPNTQFDYFDCKGIFEISDKVIQEAVQQAKKANIAILVVGENSLRHTDDKTCGENQVRPDIALAGNQEKLIKAIHQAGIPVIVVLVNGRPLALEWISENIPAVIESWEPGLQGGRAIAEVVFGDYNPGGRLPITFSRSVGHITEYYNHRPSMYFRKYVVGSTGPLYTFGYGLSYTSFEYSDLKFKQEITSGDDLNITVNIKNIGGYEGDEVVMIYLKDEYSSVTTPVKKLVAFTRVGLKPGEDKEVDLIIHAKDMSLYNEKLIQTIEPGAFKIIVGDDKLDGSFMVK